MAKKEKVKPMYVFVSMIENVGETEYFQYAAFKLTKKYIPNDSSLVKHDEVEKKINRIMINWYPHNDGLAKDREICDAVEFDFGNKRLEYGGYKIITEDDLRVIRNAGVIFAEGFLGSK